jgi:DNA-directed RNA polymerase specialized sigma24 family protein
MDFVSATMGIVSGPAVFHLLNSCKSQKARQSPEDYQTSRQSFRDKTLREYAQNMPYRQPGGRGEEQILQEFSQLLPETERRLWLLFMAGLSYQQLAEEAGILETTLRSKILRLKNLFQKRYL